MSGLVAVFHDVSEAQAMVRKMTHLAEHDILDSLGHLAGDQLLQAVALRIGPCVRSSDTVSRQGGDEFIVLLSEISGAEDAAINADKMRLAVLEPHTVANHVLQLTASIGVSVHPDDGSNPEALIHCADTAVRYAKQKGRNRNQFFKRHPTLGVLHPLEFIQIAGYLKRFPINTLKLDKSFVHDIPENANIATIVRSVISMGQSLHVVADGVENAEQLKFLQAYGCAEGQGYYFSRSVDPTACQALIFAGGRRWAAQRSSSSLRDLK